MKSVILKVGGATRGHCRRFPLFHGASNMCTNFFPNPCSQVVHNYHTTLRGKRKRKPSKLGIICERYWLLKFSPNFDFAFEQHMETPSKTSNANLTKNPTCSECEIFICYLGPHGSGHHSILVDTFPST